MQRSTIWHRISIILGVLSLLTITYTTILLNNFRTPEATTDFLKNSNAYYYISEIIKATIRDRYPDQLKSNVLKLTTADTLLNSIVSPNTVERLALPALKLRQRAAQLPLSFVQNNLVINTQQYTQQASTTLSSLQLPGVVSDAANNLIASIPPQITIVDTQKNPNSILVSITKTRILFQNIQKILNIAWIIFLLSLAVLVMVNVQLLQRLIWGLFLIAVITGGIVFLASYIVPWIASSLSSNPDPVTGVLRDQLWDSMLWYFFARTRSVSLIMLLVALGLYLLHRFVPLPKVQAWMQAHIPGQAAHPTPPKRTTGRKRS